VPEIEKEMADKRRKNKKINSIQMTVEWLLASRAYQPKIEIKMKIILSKMRGKFIRMEKTENKLCNVHTQGS
jgi:hypothetical protein